MKKDAYFSYLCTYQEPQSLIDPQLARWHQIDPLTEKYAAWSGYNYVGDNPVGFIDPDGKSAEASIVGNKVIVRANIIFYGGGASPELAREQAAQIQKDWNAAKGKAIIGGKSYNVAFEITEQYNIDDANGPSNLPTEIMSNKSYLNNYIRVEDKTNRASNTSYTDTNKDKKSGGNTGFWKLSQLVEGAGNSGTHEFGHQLGLKDISDTTPCCAEPPNVMLTAPNSRQVASKYNEVYKDGTVVFDISHRKVTQGDIQNLNISNLEFINGKANIGVLTNEYKEMPKY